MITKKHRKNNRVSTDFVTKICFKNFLNSSQPLKRTNLLNEFALLTVQEGHTKSVSFESVFFATPFEFETQKLNGAATSDQYFYFRPLKSYRYWNRNSYCFS